MTSIRELNPDRAVRALTRLADGTDRVIVGITGAPGAGKSTAAKTLARRCTASGVPTVVVPMDGFHLAQAVLEARGWAPEKGAPHTFDGAGYVALIERIRRERRWSVWAPAFERTLEDPVAGSIEVAPQTRLVITEGNYLLSPDEPWSELPGLLDAVWYVDTPDQLRLDWLIARRRRYGATMQEATDLALGPDERNAELIRASRDRADAFLQVE
ncbi:nucleoside/nucleotide kinase family protein [Flexivirga oryzae]|uniref:Pantothenate kinase n=1 Tax=Flexivirga oryzae TaxID=1794944 RepID=A0A839ND91_9MICO|nr:pantothenate kinase [Flexivirga oryzae]